jgi:hypothetical protein
MENVRGGKMEPREGRTRTPWGTADYVKKYAEGVWFVSTPGHGGLKLDRKRNALVPEYMRREGGWYEEDCEWALAVAGLGIESTHVIPGSETSGTVEKVRAEVRRTFGTWYPDEYERFYGETLKPGESYVKDGRAFKVANRENWVVISACGSEGPDGMVMTTASKGGVLEYGSETRSFLVPDGEYRVGRFGFVIDTLRHEAA